MAMSAPETSQLFEDEGFRHVFCGRWAPSEGAQEGRELSFFRPPAAPVDIVDISLAHAARALAVAPERIYYLSQVHGCGVRLLQGDEDRTAVLNWEGDVTISARQGVACGVRTADCPAVLLADRKSGAVAAIHSGWRGTVAGVVAAGVHSLRELAAEEATDGAIIAAIGPHIEACCFEVGADVAAEIAASAPGAAAGAAAVRVIAGGKPHVDLRQVISAQLQALGVETIEHVAGCTMCDGDRYHSYRRDGAGGGRMLAAIVPASRG